MQRWLFFQAAHVSPACIPVFRATNARVQAFWQATGDAQLLAKFVTFKARLAEESRAKNQKLQGL